MHACTYVCSCVLARVCARARTLWRVRACVCAHARMQARERACACMRASKCETLVGRSTLSFNGSCSPGMTGGPPLNRILPCHTSTCATNTEALGGDHGLPSGEEGSGSWSSPTAPCQPQVARWQTHLATRPDASMFRDKLFSPVLPPLHLLQWSRCCPGKYCCAVMPSSCSKSRSVRSPSTGCL